MLKQSETPRRKPWRSWVSAAAAVAVLAAGSMAAREWIPATSRTQSESSIALQKTADSGENMQVPAPNPNPNETSDMLYTATPEAGGAARNGVAYSANQSMKDEAAPAAGETVQGVKIIRTASYTLNTMQFEHDLEAVKALSAKYNGWVEYAGISGDKAHGDMRFANLTLRIPTQSLDSFESGVTSIGRVTDSNVSATDVSESYSDTQMRLQTQKDKMERLRALMNTTGELADLLAVENEIANTQYQIDSYESSLRGIDSRVNFTSIQVYLQEETSKDAASTKELTLGERIIQGLKATWQATCEFAQDLAVFLVMILPIVIPAALILFIVLKVHKHRKQTKQQ